MSDLQPDARGPEVAKRILVVDDEIQNRMLLEALLVTALSEVTDRVKALESGADDFLSKPVDKTDLRARVKSLIHVKAYNDYMKHYQSELEREVAAQTEQLRESLKKLRSASLDTIVRLCRAAEYRDNDTGDHIMRISIFSGILARELGMDDAFVDLIQCASPLHDIGKLAMPDGILKKAGSLSEDEWSLMRMHAEDGARILSDAESDIINAAESIALCHHEKWDGTGYPAGLSGDDIPIRHASWPLSTCMTH